MTIKELRDYRIMSDEMAQREQKLKDDKHHVVDAVQTAANHPYWKHTIPIEGDVWPYPLDSEYKKLAALKIRTVRILSYVAEIRDYRVRRAIEVRFIDNYDGLMTWERAADIIGGGVTGNSLKQLVFRYLRDHPENFDDEA